VKVGLDFVVVGAQKSGTTTLFEYLRRHPEIYLPPGKEAPFYSDDVAWEGGWDLYVQRNFAAARDDEQWGTVTPQYLYGSLTRTVAPDALEDVLRPELLVPERIASHSPGALLVAVLRDPVERAYSHYRMEVLRETEHRSFEVVVDELLRPEQLERSRRRPTETTAYVTNGEFGRLLAPYVELFGRDRLLVCFASDLATEPADTLASVLHFLGVDDTFRPANLGERYRVGGSRRRLRRLDLHRLEGSVARNRGARAAWHALPPAVRARVDRTFKEAAYQVDVRNRVTSADAPSADPAAEASTRLREHFAADRELLSSLLGYEPPW
jgi:hypothetical protein